jgi:2-polyprenyl-6-methoxyphenol hydroxylase-like FAD-dependent oxidoreductase
VVVGARCAGAATAMLLARRGLRVLAVDRGRYGGDTLSTHALMRGGVMQLQRWGLLDRLRAAGTPPVRSTTFHYGDDAIEIPIKPKDGIDALYAPRRTVLDALLVDAAREAGAEVLHETRMLELLRDDSGHVNGVVLSGAGGEPRAVRAGIVIGADGVRSQLAREVGARAYLRGEHCTGVAYGYWSGVRLAGNHWYYRPGRGAGSIPTNDGNTCVFASVPSERFEEELRQDAPAAYRRVIAACDAGLAQALEAATPAGKLWLFAGVRGHVRQSWGPGWALVGDAAYFKDPFTAHGITDALRDAELLAGAVAAGGDEALAAYQQRRDALSRELFELTDEIASFDWDLPTVQRLHRRLSEEMGREVEALLELDAPAPVSRSA